MINTDKRFQYILLIVTLMIILILVLLSFRDTNSKKLALEQKVNQHTEALLSGHDLDDLDLVSVVIAEKSLFVVGDMWGVIRLYIREKDDVMMDSFFGLEYFYDYKDEEWIQQDSSSILLPEHIVEAYKTFETKGFMVADEAYEKF